MAKESQGKKIHSVENVFDIIETIKSLDNPGITDISSEIDLSKSTIHAHLNTLLEKGYVIQNDGYRMSLKFLNLGGYIQQSGEYRELYKIAKPEIDELAQNTEERAALMIEENGKGYFLYMVEGQRAVSTDSHLGWELPLHSTACGKAYLSQLPEREVEEILDKRGLPEITQNTITEKTQLMSELEEVSDSGIAFDEGERLPGIYCVGVPITTEAGDVLGSISVSLPSHRADSEWFRVELPDQVANTARVIGLNSMYS